MPLVKDLMSESLAVVSPEDHLHDALTMMNRAGYRHLPVVMDDKLVGIITDRDLRLAVNSPVVDAEANLTREAILDEVCIGDCMTPNPQTVRSDTPLGEVADLLALDQGDNA